MERRKSIFSEAGFLSQVCGAVLNLALSAVKMYVGMYTNSISILTDGYNNLADFGSNVCGGIGVAMERKEPTEKHPHGFGRVEDLVSFLMLIAVGIVGFSFVYLSTERLFFHPPVAFIWWGFCMVAATVVVKIIMYFVYARAYRVNPSPIIRINKVDCLMDAGVTAMTLVSYGVSATGKFAFDSIGGIVIGAVLLAAAVKLFRENVSGLVGNDAPARKTEKALNDRGIFPHRTDAHSYGRRIEADVFVSGGVPEDVLDALKLENIFVNVINTDREEGKS